MGPTALFNISLLQSLNPDEAVLFDAFFQAVICPIFFVESLADLGKELVSNSSQEKPMTPESLLSSLAYKTPQMHGAVCAHHADMIANSLAGQSIPMTGQIPVPHPEMVESESNLHALFRNPPEQEAFERWQNGQFDEVERSFASDWRDKLGNLDLERLATVADRFKIDPDRAKSLEGIRFLAGDIVEGLSSTEQLQLAIAFLRVPQTYVQTIRLLWSKYNHPPLKYWAPYARHVLLVEVFFWLAVKYRKVDSVRSSNRTDIAYLYYLPFCDIFVSGDRLHRSCVPLFLRKNQRFVWAQDLKEDLGRQNQRLLMLPEEQRNRGLISLHPRPADGLTRDLWQLIVPSALAEQAEQAEQAFPKPMNKQLLATMERIQNAPRAQIDNPPEVESLQSVSIQ